MNLWTFLTFFLVLCRKLLTQSRPCSDGEVILSHKSETPQWSTSKIFNFHFDGNRFGFQPDLYGGNPSAICSLRVYPVTKKGFKFGPPAFFVPWKTFAVLLRLDSSLRSHLQHLTMDSLMPSLRATTLCPLVTASSITLSFKAASDVFLFFFCYIFSFCVMFTKCQFKDLNNEKITHKKSSSIYTRNYGNEKLSGVRNPSQDSAKSTVV